MRRASLAFAAASALLLAASPAQAECTITATGVAFGTYNPTSATPLDGTGSVRLDCRHNDNPGVTVATGGSGSYASRRMANGSSMLQYNLFSDASRVSILGNGTGGTVSMVLPLIQSIGLRRIYQAPVYGRIPPRQNVRAGTYTDTLFVTVSF